MKVFRHKNGFLYSIEQNGKGNTITPPENWNVFEAVPYITNRFAPKLDPIGVWPLTRDSLKDFDLVFEK